MTRIDHDEVAREHLDALSLRDDLKTSDILALGAYAQANALLALKNVVEDLVEQQRIANLISLCNTAGKLHLSSIGNVNRLFDAGSEGLIAPNGLIHPDIATALGIEGAS